MSTASGSCPACAPDGGEAETLDYRFTVASYALKRCRRCGLELLDPQPDEATLGGIYQREYYDAWGIERDEELTRALKQATFARLLRPLARRVSGPYPRRLLDCGAATGYLMTEAAKLGFDPYGVELSEFGAGCIAERFGSERVFRGSFDAAADELPAASFDVVTMVDFLEHVRDPRAALRSAHRLLRPHGLVLIVTPDSASLSRRLLGRRWLHYKAEHLFYFTPRSLTLCLRRAGFTPAFAGRAWKAMSLHYVAHQLARYPHPVLSPIVRLLDRVGPSFLRSASLPLTFGELSVTAVKAG